VRSSANLRFHKVAAESKQLPTRALNGDPSLKFNTVCFVTGLEPGLNKFTPLSEGEVLTWDFISRSLYSASNTNPRRRIESPLKEGLDDVVREVNFCMN
jgi:hypothetical protein